MIYQNQQQKIERNKFILSIKCIITLNFSTSSIPKRIFIITINIFSQLPLFALFFPIIFPIEQLILNIQFKLKVNQNLIIIKCRMKSQEQEKILKFQVHHELIGNHSFQITEKCHMSELRMHIIENSPLCIYENFHFETGGKQICDYNQEISQLFQGDTQLNVVFDPYDYYSSKHHEEKIKEILSNPIQWAIVNSRDTNWKNVEEQTEFSPTQLENLFQNPFSSDHLSPRRIKDHEFSGMINISGFNPVPIFRKLQGDLYYIHIKTLEDTDFHVTANSQGFFVNLCTQGNFNPNPNPKFTRCICLLDLLFQISPKFKIKFQQTIRSIKISQFQRIVLNYKPIIDNFVWLKENNGWKKTNVWRNDCYSKRKQSQIPFPVVKDWTMMFQFYRSFPSETLLDKMNREKLRYKTYQELIETALEGIENIFNGNLVPINSSLKFSNQLFYHQYLLFYFVDNQDSSLLSTRYINKDIYNLSLIESLDFDNISLTNMIIVNYRGYKIVVKTIPNSLINQETRFQSIQEYFYSNNSQQTTDDQFLVSIKKISKYLNIQSENIYVDKHTKITSMITHPDIKGFHLKENKRFIFDCSAFTPKDFNFMEADNEFSFLRPEIMKIYNSRQKCNIPFNTMLGTKYKLPVNEKVKIQQKKLTSVAKFAKQIMIPLFIDSFDDDMRKFLSDTKGIIFNLHKHGLSSKYLGLIHQKAIEKRSYHVKIMIERVILIKSLKNLFKRVLQESPLHLHRHAIKHLLNLLFQEQGNDNSYKQQNQEDQDGPNSKKNKKKKGKQSEILFEISFKRSPEKLPITRAQQLWQEAAKIAQAKFRHKLNSKSQFFKYEFSKTAILRDLCLCLGIQLQKKEYFSKDNSQTFSQQNIICMMPKVKIVLSQPKELTQLIEQGDALSNKYQLEEAFQKYNRALQYLFISFNGVHEKLALINKKIAGIYYKVGDFDTAIMSILNSCEIYESLLGPEHVQTIETYFIIAIYQFARKRFSAAEHYMHKAIFLAKFAYSECYPEIILMYLNLSTVYQTQKKYPDAIISLFLALNSSIRIYGEKHVHTAIIFTALASLHYQIPDIEQSIKYQLKAVEILQGEFGPEDERVIEAKNTWQGYKNLQNSKKIRQLHEKQQRNVGFPSSNKPSFKVPYYDFKDRPSDFIWKKNKKMKFFF